MTDFLEQLLELLEEEEERESGLHLASAELTPAGTDGGEDPVGRGLAGGDVGGAESAGPPSIGPASDKAVLRQTESGPDRSVRRDRPAALGTARGGTRAVGRMAEAAGEAAVWETAGKRPLPPSPRQSGVPPARAAEEMPDALAGEWTAMVLSQPGSGGHYAGAAPGESAAALERRLARSAARTAGQPPRADIERAEHADKAAGLDLEELDRRVRRDARRYDGGLTAY